VFRESGSRLYYLCIIGGVEYSTVELSRDRDAFERKSTVCVDAGGMHGGLTIGRLAH
jgi:hypothetical protein